jgi:hypothetical protein
MTRHNTLSKRFANRRCLCSCFALVFPLFCATSDRKQSIDQLYERQRRREGHGLRPFFQQIDGGDSTSEKISSETVSHVDGTPNQLLPVSSLVRGERVLSDARRVAAHIAQITE